MTTDPTKPLIVLTDPAPVRTRDGRCPQCGSAEKDRGSVWTFGPRPAHPICQACGYEFPEETDHG